MPLSSCEHSSNPGREKTGRRKGCRAGDVRSGCVTLPIGMRSFAGNRMAR